MIISGEGTWSMVECGWYIAVLGIHGHRTLKAPHPVRSAQLTGVPPSQYHGGGPRGNPGCCGFYFYLCLMIFRAGPFFFFSCFLEYGLGK